jgi:hypothetical protein
MFKITEKRYWMLCWPLIIYLALFPTTLQNNSVTVIDIFIDTSKFANYVIPPLFNGLSDHDVQLIELVVVVNKSEGFLEGP